MEATTAVKDEPSMEEILASIRRIISDQESTPVPAPKSKKPEPENVLELTKVVEEDGSITELEELAPLPERPKASKEDQEALASIAAAMQEEEDTFDIAEEVPEEPDFDSITDEPEPVFVPKSQYEEPVTEQFTETQQTETLVSPVTIENSLNALAGLQSFITSQTRLYEDQNTIEGVVRSLLKPMLKDWLDSNLPGIVEKLVSAEIRRLSGLK
jgi:uncharacterized protein